MERPLKGTDKLVLGEYNQSSNVWTIHVPVYWSPQDRAAEENRKNTERINRNCDQLQYGILGVRGAPRVVGASITGAPYVAIALKAVTSAVGRLVINGAVKVASKVLSPGAAMTGGAGAVAGNEGVKRSPAVQNLLTNGLGLFQRSEASRVFWSGGDGAKNAAATFARENGLKTLEMTWSGRVMDVINPVLPKAVSGPLWTRLSVSFANSTTRDAYVFQNASSGVRINSIWATKEYDILIEKGVNIHFYNVWNP